MASKKRKTKLLALDFETYYDNEYSLKKLTTQDYVTDKRFRALLCAVKTEDEAFVLQQDSIWSWMRKQDWENIGVIGHNLNFDGAVLYHQYKIQPKFYLDTIGMARATLRDKTHRFSLAKVAEVLGLPAKGDAVVMAKGKMFGHFTREEWKRYMEYCAHDAWLAWEIYHKLRPMMPDIDMLAMHTVVRASVVPSVVLDTALLQDHANELEGDREKDIAQLDRMASDILGERVDLQKLRSAEKFASILTGLGIPEAQLPKKVNDKGVESLCFAKNFKPFTDLLEHDDPVIRTAVEVKTKANSSLAITRATKLAGMGRRHPEGIALPTIYYATHTGRLGGTDGLNFQNMPRVGKLRESLTAPPGHTVVAIDASQIEARLVAYMAGQTDVVAAYTKGEDVYAQFAARLYGGKADDWPKGSDERQVGKVAELQLGYGSGAMTFQGSVRVQGGVLIDLAESKGVVQVYRKSHRKIVKLWHDLNAQLPYLSDGSANAEFGCGVHLSKDRIILPNGLFIGYPGLRRFQQKYDKSPNWYYMGRGLKKIYGGAITENIIQALAAIITRAAMAYMMMYGYFCILQVHDEIIFIVPNNKVDECRRLGERFLCRAVEWAPGLPLAAESKIGPNYGNLTDG